MSVYGWVGEAFALEAFEDHRPCAGQLAIFLLQVGGAGRFLWLGASMRELAQLYHCRVDCSLVITITRQGRIFFSIGFVCVCMAEKRI